MKKVITIMGFVMVASLMFTHCGTGAGSEKERDAREVAEMACEMRMMILNMDEGDFDGFTQFTEKMAEFAELMEELEAKYGEEVESDEFEELIRKGLKRTPCGDVELEDLFDFF